MRITKKEARKAKRLVDLYERQSRAAIVNSNGYTCACCKNNVVKPIEYNNLGIRDLLKQEQQMWSNGTIVLVSFGYGSSLDMEQFYMAVCDDCAKSLQKENFLIDHKYIREQIKRYGL